jgi:hypothetical protein
MWRLFCVAKLRRHCPVQPLTLANRAWLGPGSLAPDLETGELTTDPSRARYGMDEFHFQGDYFMYHHSDADTMEILDPAQMDRSVALWAAYAYVLGNLPEMLPRLAPAQPAPAQAELDAAFGPVELGPLLPGTPSSGDGGGVGLVALVGAAVGGAILGAGAVKCAQQWQQQGSIGGAGDHRKGYAPVDTRE